ncbi:MAG: double zinc ribbon domain-containing protein [Ruminococcus sp.]
MFCKTCGYNLNAEKQVLSNKKICQNCGGMNNADGKFCIKCGRRL